jgi:hypothetical protein
MLKTLGACISQFGDATKEYPVRNSSRRLPDAKVFRRLEKRVAETVGATPASHSNAGRPRSERTPANGDAVVCSCVASRAEVHVMSQ